MRVVIVAASSSTSGGGEKHVADLLRRLPLLDVDVSIVCPPGELADLAESRDILVFPIDLSRPVACRELGQLRSVIEKLNPELVHAHGSRAAFFARVADKRATERLVYTIHGIHVDKAGSLPRRIVLPALERFLRPKTALFITVSKSDAEYGARLRLLDPLKTMTVYNGIEEPPLCAAGEFRRELGLEPNTLLALSIGRLHEQKDHMTLLKAWKRVSDAAPKSHLALIGSGRQRDSLRATIESLGLNEHVTLAEPRTDLCPAYTDSDVFVLSSRWEGFPYVVLEAMAYGLPVVATNVGGVPEAVLDGESGLLVDPGKPAVLGEALLRLLSSSSERQTLGEVGRLRVRERFGIDQMIEGTVAGYKRAIGKQA